jgi:carboxyl-terminal processing protease
VWTVLFVVSLGLLVAVTSFGAGMLAERDLFAGGSLLRRARESGGIGGGGAPNAEAAFPRVAEVRNLIEEEYYFRPASPEALPAFRAELERDAVSGMATAAAEVATANASPVAAVDEYLRELEYGALRGMADGLEDDYTTFLEPVEQAPVAQQMAGEYEGIGVSVEQPAGAFTIVATFPGSPAEAAGLRPGDVIEAADGRQLAGVTQDDAVAVIRGPAGTVVRLTIRRPGEAATFEAEVERQAITTPVVTYRAVAEGRVGHIRIGIFNDKTTQQLDAALKRAKEEGVTGIVLDLRQNGGGWVTSAREAIGRFVPEERGPALYEDERPGEGGEPESVPIVGGGEEAFELPLVVLVDGGTASAAEIVAGALRDHDRATLVGMPTYGKGLVQRVHDFADGSSLRITSAEWLTPNGDPIPVEGLRPEVVVEMPADPAAGGDAQLDRAVEVVLGGG